MLLLVIEKTMVFLLVFFISCPVWIREMVVCVEVFMYLYEVQLDIVLLPLLNIRMYQLCELCLLQKKEKNTQIDMKYLILKGAF